MNKTLVVLIILVIALKWSAVAWLLACGYEKAAAKAAPIG